VGSDDKFDTDLYEGKLTAQNYILLGFSEKEYERVCEGWGSAFCLNCPYQEYMPDDCEGECESCERVCPCNRKYEYEKVRKLVMVAENNRIHSGILT